MYQNPILTKFLAKNLKLRVIGLAVFLTTTAALQAQVIFESSVTVENNLLVDGNVGIGHTIPLDRLHINGDIRVGSTTVGNAEFRTLISSSGTSPAIELSNNGGDMAWLIGAYDTDNQLQIKFFSGGNRFDHSWDAQGVRFVTLRQDGNLGIGVDDPTAKLEVNGEAKATSFEGNGDKLLFTPQGDIPMFGQ